MASREHVLKSLIAEYVRRRTSPGLRICGRTAVLLNDRQQAELVLQQVIDEQATLLGPVHVNSPGGRPYLNSRKSSVLLEIIKVRTTVLVHPHREVNFGGRSAEPGWWTSRTSLFFLRKRRRKRANGYGK